MTTTEPLIANKGLSTCKPPPNEAIRQWGKETPISLIMTKLRLTDPVFAAELSPRLLTHLVTKCLVLSPADIEAVRQSPQRSPSWFRARNGCADLENEDIRPPLLTGSVLGAILGHNSYMSEDAVLREKITDLRKAPSSFGQNIMRKGTAWEPLQQKLVQIKLQGDLRANPKTSHVCLTIVNDNLRIAPRDQWMAVSPDGIIRTFDPLTGIATEGGLEMKTPAFNIYDKIKPDYYDQIQSTMYVLGYKTYTFTCYTARALQIETYAYDAEYWEGRCMPAAFEFFFYHLYPMYLLKVYNRLCPETMIPRTSEQGKFILSGGTPPSNQRRCNGSAQDEDLHMTESTRPSVVQHAIGTVLNAADVI